MALRQLRTALLQAVDFRRRWPFGYRQVFNTGGNDFRLITEIFYEDETILLRHVLTHAEYDKGAWKK